MIDGNNGSKGKRGRGFNTVEMLENYAVLILTDRNGRETARTKVSFPDLDRLMEFGKRWYLTGTDERPYVQLRQSIAGGKSKCVMLHRFLLGSEATLVVDHINGDQLDNRRENLRHVTPAENSQNRRATKDSKSGIKNICWDTKRQKWRAYLCANGRRMNLGYHSALEQAKDVVREARRKYHPSSMCDDLGTTA